MTRYGIRFTRYLSDSEKDLLTFLSHADVVKIQDATSRASTITIWCPTNVKDITSWMNALSIKFGERLIASEPFMEQIPD